MHKIKKIPISKGVFWVEIPEVDLKLLCGCPADSVKHLTKKGLIQQKEVNGIVFETGPNAILLSDLAVQNGQFTNLSEFPILHMFYKQGMLLPNHPNNTGRKPIIIGGEEQVVSQLNYIYRGNYGLQSEEEIIQAGINQETAALMMTIKLKFAFGQITEIDDLIEAVFLEKKQMEIINGVYIRRIDINIFEIEYQDELITINLNLNQNDEYQVSYALSFHKVSRDYFTIIHTGEGNGWDINRPCMSSIIMYQGNIYLIDAGPNLIHSIKALGISLNEITGIFHTHCHDDHFAGLTTLLQADHKIKYYSSSLVRHSVIKKFSSLLNYKENTFNHFFEIIDLELNQWNYIDGLEILPVFSPHPVETNIFYFRTLYEKGYATYGHLADVVSFDVLKRMISKNKDEPGISEEYFHKIHHYYLLPCDLKKIDIGGGLIHGQAIDYKQDKSTRIILSHIDTPLTKDQKEIGSSAGFGMINTLIPTHHNYLMEYARKYLTTYFPNIPDYLENILLNNQIVSFNPETIIIKEDQILENIYLTLTGDIEKIRADSDHIIRMSAGSFLGVRSSINRTTATVTYRSINYVFALQIPFHTFMECVQQCNLKEIVEKQWNIRMYLERNWLFSESISNSILVTLSRLCYEKKLKKAEIIETEYFEDIFLIKKGKIEILLDNMVLETLTEGDIFGEEGMLDNAPSLCKYKTTTNCSLIGIPHQNIKEIPIVLWKLLETSNRRMKKILNPSLSEKAMFIWHNEYNINVMTMDMYHRKIFNQAHKLLKFIDTGKKDQIIKETLGFLMEYTIKHFHDEEKLLSEYQFPDLDVQHKCHQEFKIKLDELKNKYSNNEQDIKHYFLVFFKNWFLNHILTEDRKYGIYLNDKGVY
ncbi:MAG: bacteriohemerythrin [Spirochaetes bacterium]|nr:bacteriohemerythrin [Spirochaetota bacterium]